MPSRKPTGRLYFIAAFFALVTEAAWSSKFLVPETLPAALATYGAFALLYLGVPHLARRRGTPLRPAAGPGVVLLFGLLLLMYFADARVATAGLWGLALLLAILNAALFIESASASLPLLALARQPRVMGRCCSAWWSEAAAVVGLMSSLLVVVGLVAGHGRRLPVGPEVRRAEDGQPWKKAARRPRQGLWLALLGHLFLFASRSTSIGRCRRGRSSARLAVVALAFSVAVAGREAARHSPRLRRRRWPSSWSPGAHDSAARRWAAVAIAAFGVLTLFCAAWIRVMSRFASVAAITAAIVLVFSEINLS